MDEVASATGSPAVVQASFYRFQGGERIRNTHVASSAWVWCERGHGRIRTEGHTFRITAGHLLQLPWMHEVQYLADEQDPFVVGGVHALAWYDDRAAIVPRAAHGLADPLRADPSRLQPQHVLVPRAPAALHVVADDAVNLGRLAIRIIDSPDTSDAELRALGVLIFEERRRLDRGSTRARLPASLRKMQGFILAELHSQLSVEAISRQGGCSAATAERLFTRHAGLSIQRWVGAARMEQSAALLRTTSLRVNEVGREVGYQDAFYFSRVFSKTFGVSPRSFRNGELHP